MIPAAIERGAQLPKWYLDEPPKLPGDDFYLRAFHLLGTCRVAFGERLGPIPWLAVRAYAVQEQLDRQTTRLFEDVIAAMDLAHMEWCEARGSAMRKMRESRIGPDEVVKQAKAEVLGG